ncbi:MAG: Ig-like domain-containing protein [Candidatus Diapherotrites archaeon]|uniref:Ig-like domain-containing protein n=1 Tax=Candidatus Iainarchaeum sp. TaxID=3101447 RepID=A0A8T3YLJ5_9ARCH|nr:Ig-like domain-containing protein [Candidatus Diapherotrites archaeon]
MQINPVKATLPIIALIALVMIAGPAYSNGSGSGGGGGTPAPVCGNGLWETGEQCDFSASPTGCAADLTCRNLTFNDPCTCYNRLPSSSVSTPQTNYGLSASVSVTGTGTDPEGYVKRVELYWRKGAGSWTNFETCTPSPATSPVTCTDSFSTDSSGGTYTVAANVYDTPGAGAQDTKTIYSYSCYNVTGQTCNTASSCAAAGKLSGSGSCGTGELCCAPAPPISVDAGGPYSGTTGSGIGLNGTVSGGVGGYSYSWSGPGVCSFSGSSSTIEDPTITCSSTVSSGSVSITGTDSYGNNASDSATLDVSPPSNASPSVSITGPVTGGNTFTTTAPANITLSANASDSDGSITQVEFFRNGTSITEDTTSPYSIPWNNVGAGTYTITAVATDDDGATTTSSSITVVVNHPPISATISQPTAGTYNVGAGTINLSGSASGGTGTGYTYLWTATGCTIASATSASTTMSSCSTGNKTVSLRVRDSRCTAAQTTCASEATTSVTITINYPPTASLTSPTPGTTTNLHMPSGLTLQATASDSDGDVTKVEFYGGTTKLGEDTTSPYSFTWTPDTAGTYTVTAKATDNQGATGTSTGATVEVYTAVAANAGPDITINPGTATNVTGSASGGSGGWSYSWTLPNPNKADCTINSGANSQTVNITCTSQGDHSTLRLRATDSTSGTDTDDATINVNIAPASSITSPAANSNFMPGSNITIQANATDGDGTVSKVEFYNGATLLGEDTTSPYTYTWSSVAAGTYTLTAKATDNLGATTTSAGVSITVSNSAPVVDAPAVTSNNSFTAPTTLTMSTTATDSDGSVASVQFLKDGTVITGTVTKSGNTYTQTLAGVATGTYSITARATDNAGTVTGSAATSVTVYAPLTVSIKYGGSAITSRTVNKGVANTFTAEAAGGNGTYSGWAWAIKPGTTNSASCSFATPNAQSTEITCTSEGQTSTIRASVQDGRGITATADAAITVNNSPYANITAPVSPNNVFTTQGTTSIPITASAGDADDDLSSVTFYHDEIIAANIIGTDSTSPYNATWSGVGIGTYTIIARAADSLGAVGDSAPQQVIVRYPALTASANGPYSGTKGTQTELTSGAGGGTGTAYKYRWVSSDASCDFANGEAFSALADDYVECTTKGTKDLTLTVRDSRCTATQAACDYEESASTTIAVNDTPTLSITSPATNSVFTTGSTITIEATASDSDGTIQKVEFIYAGTAFSTDTSAPYSATWTVPSSTGSYVIAARATDDKGAFATKNITIIANAPPSISITNPAAGASYNTPASTLLSANASDGDDGLSKVEFLEGATSIGKSCDTAAGSDCSGSPYTFQWSNISPGNHTIKAVATDSRGASTNSAEVSFTVTNAAPTVSVTIPANNSIFDTPASITLTASASDTDGIGKAEFYDGAAKLGDGTLKSGTTDIYEYAWAPGAGAYAITAKAYDSWDLAAQSSPAINVTINQPPIPTLAASGAPFVAPADITLTANASDPDTAGKITKIEFWNYTNPNSPLLLSTSNIDPPAQAATAIYTWPGLAAGTYTTKAKAYDDKGSSAISSEVTMTVAPTPTCAISPANPTITQGENATETVTTQHFKNPLSLTNTDIACNGAAQKSVTCSSGTCTITCTNYTTSGTITATTTDSGKTVTCTATATVVAQNLCTNSGTCTLASQGCAAGTFNNTADTCNISGGTICCTPNLTANAGADKSTDKDVFKTLTGSYGGGITPHTVQWSAPAVANCVFFFGNTLNPWVSCSTNGNKTITLTVTDDRGVSASDDMVLSVNEPPTASITSPADGANPQLPTTVTITVSAGDADGTVQEVKIFDGATELRRLTAAPYTYSWVNPTTGAHSLTAKATDDKGATTTSAAINITIRAANVAPSASITSPQGGDSFATLTATTLTANASDSDGTVSSVKFYVGGTTLIGEDTSSPYDTTWTTPTTPGTYSLTAVATDNQGATTTSATVNISVTNRSPEASITSPATGTIYNPPVNITLNATASDLDGTVSKVEFYNGDTKLGEDTTSPYAYTWNSVAAGTYTLTAKATDNLGAQTVSTAISVTVNQPPAISITSPADGDTAVAPADIGISADASDTDGTISSIDFYNYTALIGSASIPANHSSVTGTFTWSSIAPGTYSLTAVAKDNHDAQTTSAAATITVTPTPTCAISPANPTITEGENGIETVTTQHFANPLNLTNADIACNGAAQKSVTCSSGTCTITCTNYTTSGTITATTTDSGKTVTCKATATVVSQDLCGNSGTCTPASQGCATGTFNNTADTCNIAGGTICCTPNLAANAGADKSTDTDTLVQLTGTHSGGISPYTVEWSAPTPANCIFTAPNSTTTMIACSTNGDKTITFTATDDRGISAPDDMVLSVNSPPVISITGPASGTSVQSPAPITITVSATDNDGSIAKVEILDGASVIATLTATPFTYTWTDASVGQHSLSARATDNSGAATTSAPVEVTVTPPNVPPSITLALPANGSSFKAGSNVTIAASASDSDGSVANVQFFDGATAIGTDDSAPYSVTWIASGLGQHSITAMATDNQGASTTTAPVSITVTPANRLPNVSLTQPPDGAVYPSAPASFTATAEASDPDGTIAKVEFFLNGTLVPGTVTQSGSAYSIEVSSLTQGAYALVAKATDDDGAAGSSSPVSIYVNVPPTSAKNNIVSAKISADKDEYTIDPADPAKAITLTITATWLKGTPPAGIAFSVTQTKDGLETTGVPSGGSITLTGAPASGSAQATVQLADLEPGAYTFTAIIDGQPGETDLADNSDNVTVTVNGERKAAVPELPEILAFLAALAVMGILMRAK